MQKEDFTFWTLVRVCRLDWEKTLFCFVYKLSIAVRLAGDDVVWFVSPLSVEDFKFDSFIFR